MSETGLRNRIIFLCLCLFLATGCITRLVERKLIALNKAENLKAVKGSFVKAHLYNGDVIVFETSELQAQDTSRMLSGKGQRYNAKRERVSSVLFSAEGEVVVDEQGDALKAVDIIRVPYEEIAFLEINRMGTSIGAVVMGVIAIPSMILTIACLANPKACFGSCPTVYAFDGDSLQLMAEGFSSSVAPGLEDKDIDHLYGLELQGHSLQLQVKNEALETHAIRQMNLLLAPRNKNSRVFATRSGQYFEASRTLAPAVCVAEEGNVLPLIKEADRVERFSLADSQDLRSKEELEVVFEGVGEGDWGLVVGSRQTLLTTFLMYQTIAYLGSSYPYLLTQLGKEGVNTTERGFQIWKMLGGIEISQQNAQGKWEPLDVLAETGPLATDFKLVPLSSGSGSQRRLKLRMTRGLWRIDYLALAKMETEVQPVRIFPGRVSSPAGNDSLAFAFLSDPTRHLFTYPGESYTLHYTLPEEASDYEVFLEAEGYYLEWMREGWLKEEDPRMVATMLMKPKRYLKMMAPHFKQIEKQMEHEFWNSKYEQP